MAHKISRWVQIQSNLNRHNSRPEVDIDPIPKPIFIIDRSLQSAKLFVCKTAPQVRDSTAPKNLDPYISPTGRTFTNDIPRNKGYPNSCDRHILKEINCGENCQTPAT